MNNRPSPPAEDTGLPEIATSSADGDGGEARFLIASQWRLMWWRFRKHRLALFSLFAVGAFALAGTFAEFLATGDPQAQNFRHAYLPPQRIHWFDDGWLRPHVYEIHSQRDPETLQLMFEVDPQEKIPIRFWAKGTPYRWLGLIPANRHLLAIEDHPKRTHIYLLGTDKLGRDLWSRLMYGTRISMSIGLVGVCISLVLGITLGGISGLYGGWIDMVIQRVIEFLRSIPTIPLWMGLAAALPRDWSIVQVYFAVTLLFSLIGWTGMARVVRGKFLALREEDFVTAARLVGCSELRIIFRHMVPSFTSHIIATTTLAIPSMILGETALSFLGLGLRPPALSWGVLLQDAQNVQSVALYPWMMTPALAVIIAVLAFNFLGDGLRDAADPYAH